MIRGFNGKTNHVNIISYENMERFIDELILDAILRREYIEVRYGLSEYDTLHLFNKRIDYSFCHMTDTKGIELRKFGEDIQKALYEQGIPHS